MLEQGCSTVTLPALGEHAEMSSLVGTKSLQRVPTWLSDEGLQGLDGVYYFCTFHIRFINLNKKLKTLCLGESEA